MDLGLRDKVIMVAASSRGLGYGIADRLAAEGARVCVASRTDRQVHDAARDLTERHGVDVRPYVMDASAPETIRGWIDDTLHAYGVIDGLVVNAGGPPPGTFDTFDDEAWSAAFNLTLMSAVRMIRGVLPSMREAGRGSILTVTSTTVKEPVDMLLLSNVFRSGVVSLVKSLSRDLASHGIRINNLVPGRIDTDRVRSLDGTAAAARGIDPSVVRGEHEAMIPMGRYGTIGDFGSAAAFLLSDAAGYITGATLQVDGGMTRTVW